MRGEVKIALQKTSELWFKKKTTKPTSFLSLYRTPPSCQRTRSLQQGIWRWVRPKSCAALKSTFYTCVCIYILLDPFSLLTWTFFYRISTLNLLTLDLISRLQNSLFISFPHDHKLHKKVTWQRFNRLQWGPMHLMLLSRPHNAWPTNEVWLITFAIHLSNATILIVDFDRPQPPSEVALE